jgi:hypothetical protein
VEGSKFFLFSVVFPVRCISSISPRFYFRRHTFCFLPLAAILEFLKLGDFNILLSPMKAHLDKKINKKPSELYYTIDQMDIFKVFHLAAKQYTFFLAAHGTFSKTNHFLGHKASLSKQI